MSSIPSRLLLEQELRRSCILTDDSQVNKVVDLVTDLIERGLIEINSGLSSHLSDPRSEQPGGMVKAYCQPNYNGEVSQEKFLLRFADADVCDRHFDNEVEARAAFEAATLNWNCYLFGLLER